MDAWVDREHHLRARAEQVAALLTALWGDLPPISPNPQMSALMDAVAGDDEHGRSSQLVVHGDGLTYAELAAAVLDPGPRSAALANLPPRLLQRLVSAGVVQVTVSPGMAALPDEDCGAWELEAGTGTVSFDAVCARLLGVGYAAGQASFPLQISLQHTGSTPPGEAGLMPLNGLDLSKEGSGPAFHPHDRPVVVAALAEALATGRSYQTRFRVRVADGSWAWRASRARVLPATATSPMRLVGFIAADEWSPALT